MVATHKAGLVVDGSVRDLDGISEIDMPAYIRGADPTPIDNVMLTGINVPVRYGTTTVMPGDLVVGDREGVYFIPPQFAKEVLDRADEIHIHDEWTKKKFAEGKYRSSEIYSFLSLGSKTAAGVYGIPAEVPRRTRTAARRETEVTGDKPCQIRPRSALETRFSNSLVIPYWRLCCFSSRRHRAKLK